MTTYDVGDRVTQRVEFTNPAGALESPSTVVGDYRTPSGTAAVTLTPTVVSVGVWEMTLPTFDEPGTWYWYMAGTAGVIAAHQGSYQVRRKLTA